MARDKPFGSPIGLPPTSVRTSIGLATPWQKSSSTSETKRVSASRTISIEYPENPNDLRLFSSNAVTKLSIATCVAWALEEDRAIPDEGADPKQHDRDERIDLQGIVRQLRRDRAPEVAGREHEPQLECGWYDKQ